MKRTPLRKVSAQKRRDDRAWLKIRAEILERDDNRCLICGLPATEVHHRKQVSLGGDDSPENLVSLDHACHMDVHDEIGLYTSLGFLVRSWENVGNVCVWVNRDQSWGAPDVDWWFLPPEAARYMPEGPVETLRDRLDERGRLFTLVHNAIPDTP